MVPVEAAAIEHHVEDGQILPIGGLEAIHVPGHCAGQLAFLWPAFPSSRLPRLDLKSSRTRIPRLMVVPLMAR